MAKKRPSTRRDFLTGRAAVRAAEDLSQRAGGTDEDPAVSPAPITGSPAPVETDRETYLVSYTRQAMACEFAIYLNAGQGDYSTDAVLEALDQVECLEDQLTVYRDDSELQDINRLAGQREVEVEEGLFGLLRLACELFEQTSGAFDITSGPLSRVWGFSRRSGRMPSDAEIGDALARVGGSHVQLDDQQQTVRFLRPDLEINVNAIGKGYALDVCGQMLRDQGVEDYLFHGGQSSVLAAGSHAKSPARGWAVGLRHPMRPERRLAEFYLTDGALGTSGSGTQFFHFQGKRYGHIIDPTTGYPASGVYSATVLAPTAAEADALATAFYVLGLEGAEKVCQQRPEIGAVLVVPGKQAGTVGIHSFGLRDEQWKRLEDGGR